MKTTYVTTPIYYANDVPHIGHAYTTLAADAYVRWKRMSGGAAYLLTGTDEHGAKIAQAAAAAGQAPRAYLDRVVEKFRDLWTRLSVVPDDFIRTSDERHVKVVQAVFEKLLKQGDIYLGAYEGWYCVPDETFLSESEIIDGKCPTCGRPVERLREESYFFKLSAYEGRLLEHFEKHPNFLSPASRAPEIRQFVKTGLRDLSVSRTKVTWGVPVPSHPQHTVYVWFDALLNYISALGYSPQGSSGDLFKSLWPADVHLVGKEIFRFHAVIWPALLMALELPLPRRVFAHGWWTVDGEKMSKSRGNVVDPHKMADDFGVDAFRYFLLREVPFGGDGDFSVKAFQARYNAELANALGNLLNRVLTLLEKNFSGRLSAGDFSLVPADARPWFADISAAYERLAFHEVLEAANGLVNRANKFAEDSAPWKTVKTDPTRAQTVLTEMARALKAVALALAPVMPSMTEEIWRQLGEPRSLTSSAASLLSTGALGFGVEQAVQKGAPLFPRKETKE